MSAKDRLSEVLNKAAERGLEAEAPDLREIKDGGSEA